MNPETIDTIPQETTVEHRHASAWKGGPGECGASCACGETYDGFDTLREASEFIDRHIERNGGTPEPAEEPAAPQPTAEEREVQIEARKRAEVLDGLEQIIAFLRDHPEVPLPAIESSQSGRYCPELHVYMRGDQRAQLATVARAMGTAEKVPIEMGSVGAKDRFNLVRRFGPIALVAIAYRDEVCERIVTGTRQVTKTVRDPEALAAVPLVEVTETVEEVRWECRPVLDGDR